MSWATSDGVRRSMLANRRRDTKPEVAIRRILHARGLRFRVDYRVLLTSRTRADIAFTRWKVAIFVDGCFWHGCPIHATQPKRNSGYWTPKLARNVERDAQASALLRQNDWTVLRYWEHEDPEDVADDIERVIRARQA
ncbi:very short patch repair endonuclease [Homoserinibacter sp. GY 40078]|uniref:very short patch repair endonuclease n=1 Tax=Homoserinibacter sp. GY 40078 TaxID=2603275 RepID=UPI0011C8F990|nr:very short patch repair endonuclease [Homoserinibacter sp. GY 40078]TXK19766.1 very short patch repair endonuclease [Homoserinibacter sp. GY 40078]